jgi:hypothetical protein
MDNMKKIRYSINITIDLLHSNNIGLKQLEEEEEERRRRRRR